MGDESLQTTKSGPTKVKSGSIGGTVELINTTNRTLEIEIPIHLREKNGPEALIIPPHETREVSTEFADDQYVRSFSLQGLGFRIKK